MPYDPRANSLSILTAVSRSSPGPTRTMCEYEGKMYPEGDFQPHPCRHCHCQGGQYHCAMLMCAPGLCADAITDSEHCCPYCPNGTSSVDVFPLSLSVPTALTVRHRLVFPFVLVCPYCPNGTSSVGVSLCPCLSLLP